MRPGYTRSVMAKNPTTSKQTAEPAKPIDWDAVKAAYCAGVMPIARILEVYGLNYAQLMRAAKVEYWERNLQGALHNEVKRQILAGETDADLEPHLKAQVAAILKVHEDHKGTASTLRETCQVIARELLAGLSGATDEVDDDGMPVPLPLKLRLIIGKQGLPAALESTVASLQRVMEMERRLWGIDKLFPNEPTQVNVNANGAAGAGGVAISIYIPDNGRDPSHQVPVA